MKRFITLTLLLIMMPTTLIGCEVESTQSDEVKEQESQYKELEISDIAYDKETKNLLYTVNNNSNSTIYYGYVYYIEKKEDNKWIKTDLTDELAFIEIAIIVEPNETKEEIIDLSNIKPLDHGIYRVVKNFNNEHGNITQYIEFKSEDEGLVNFSSYNTLNK